MISAVLALVALTTTQPGICDLHTRTLTPVQEGVAVRHAPLFLVKDGKLDFAIATEFSSSMRSRFSREGAVTVLTQVCARTFGSVPRVGTAQTIFSERYRIRLVDTGCDQSFAIASDADGLTISGHVEYGVIDFCERVLGTRWYFPGEFGSDYLQLRDLTLPPLRYSDAPYFNRRDPTRYYLYASLGWSGQLKHYEPYLGTVPKNDHFIPDRWRCGGTLPIAGQHCPEPRAFAKAYPDKLDVIFHRSPNGKFWYDPKSHIGNYYNVWNLEFADLLLDAWRRFYDSKGKFNPGFGGGVNDSAVSFGVCDTGISEGETNGIENVYGRFFDYLAKKTYAEFPDKKLYLMCYANCAEPPTDGKCRMPPNVELNLCANFLPSKVTVPAQVERVKRNFRAWSDTLAGRPIARAWLYAPGQNKFARAIVPEFLGQVPKALGPLLGREELFYDYWSSDDIWHYYYAPYVMYKSMWNPEFDVDAALDELFTRMYPRAADEMKAFHALLRESHLRVGAPARGFGARYPLEVVNGLERLLAAAEKKITPGSVEMRRFRLIADYWKEPFAKERGDFRLCMPIHDALHADGRIEWGEAAAVRFINRTDGTAVAENPPDVRFAWNETTLFGRAPEDWEVYVYLSPKTDAKPQVFAFRQGVLEVSLAKSLGVKPAFHNGLFANIVAERDAHVFGSALTMGNDLDVANYGVLRFGGMPYVSRTAANLRVTEPNAGSMRMEFKVSHDDSCGNRKGTLGISNGRLKYRVHFNQYPRGNGAVPRFVFNANEVLPLKSRPLSGRILEFFIGGTSSQYLDFPAANNSRYESEDEAGWDFVFDSDAGQGVFRIFMRRGSDELRWKLFPLEKTLPVAVRYSPRQGEKEIWSRATGESLEGVFERGKENQ